MSRSWTRAAELHYRKVYKVIFCVVLMANGLLKKLGLAIAIAGSSLLGVRDAQATPVDWTSAYQNMFTDSQMVDYTTTLNFNGGVSDRNISLIYYLDCGNDVYAPIAGFNVLAGSNIANGKITRDDPTYYGLLSGQSLNSGDAPGGRWDVVFDWDNDGRFGVIDEGAVIYYEALEHLNTYDGFSINVSGLPAFPMGDVPQSGGFIDVYAPIGSSASTLSVFGLMTHALSDGTNIIRLQIAVTNLSSFRLECRDSLTNTTWASLGTFAATGAVTEVSDTNTVPTRFYRVVSP